MGINEHKRTCNIDLVANILSTLGLTELVVASATYPPVVLAGVWKAVWGGPQADSIFGHLDARQVTFQETCNK